MKKAVFFDIDGTLVDTFNGRNEISPAVKQSIYNLQELGYYVFVATGRPYAFVNQMLWNFGFDGFVLSNGAQVVMNGKTIYEDQIDKEFVKTLAKGLDEHGIEYVLEGKHYSYLSKSGKKLYDFAETIDIAHEMIKKEYDIDEIEIYKIEILCESEEVKELCADLIKDYPEYDYYYSISGSLLEIYAKRNHKARGIEKTLELLEIPIENSYAFGDGENDIEMLQTVGCGIAMGNASDHVKTYAKEVTDTVANDGVAVGVKAYILKEQFTKVG